MFSQFENTYLKIIQGDKKSAFSTVCKGFFLPLSWLYGLGARLKNWAYDLKLLKSYQAPIPAVVSIGNLTAGGTGKTPITQMLAHTLAPLFSVAILSRGYRSPAEQSNPPFVLHDKNSAPFDAKFCGDEPYMLWKNSPHTPIYISKNRCASAKQAARDAIQLAILDDGMQHRKLARDFDLVVLDADDPFGQGYTLPRGLLRESPESLKRADLIIINHTRDASQFASICEKIQRYTQAPVIAARVIVKAIKTLNDNDAPPWQGKKVGLFCAIGKPHHFKETIESLKISVVDQLILPDHQTIDKKTLCEFAERCRQKGAEALICTEKDQVKLDQTLKISLPILWTQIAIEIIEGSSHWDHLIQKITHKIQNHSKRVPL